MEISYLLPNRQKRSLLKQLMDIKKPCDELLVFNMNNRQISQILDRMIDSAKKEFVVLINPSHNRLNMDDLLSFMDSVGYIEMDCGIGFFRKDFEKINLQTKSFLDYTKRVMQNLKTYNPLPILPSKTSIIIPFMYNGDRKKLFDTGKKKKSVRS